MWRGQSGAGRFCLACGSPLAASGTGREVRKTVTVVFSDLVGSTPLGERLDPETLREVITRYYDRAAEVLARHGGTVAKFIGDAVMAVYAFPGCTRTTRCGRCEAPRSWAMPWPS